MILKQCEVCKKEFERIGRRLTCSELCRDIKLKEYNKKYEQGQVVKQRRRRYAQKPEMKAKSKEYRKKPEIKKRHKEYEGRKEVKDMRKKYRDSVWIKEKKKKYDKTYMNQPGVKGRKREYIKQYYKITENRNRRNLNDRNRIANDPKFAIGKRLRRRLLHALNAYTKTGKFKKACEYGIDYKAIIEYLKPFPKDRHLYHIDHILPLVSFSLEDPEQIKIAFAPQNHQWLLAQENLKKGSKVTVQTQLI